MVRRPADTHIYTSVKTSKSPWSNRLCAHNIKRLVSAKPHCISQEFADMQQSIHMSNWFSRPWIWRLLLFQKSSVCLFSLLSSALHLRALHSCFLLTHTVPSRPVSNTSKCISCQLGSAYFCIAWASCECLNVQLIWQKWVKWERSDPLLREIFALSFLVSLCQLLDLFFSFGLFCLVSTNI